MLVRIFAVRQDFGTKILAVRCWRFGRCNVSVFRILLSMEELPTQHKVGSVYVVFMYMSLSSLTFADGLCGYSPTES